MEVKALLVGVLALLVAAPALLAAPVAGRTLGELVRADRELSDLAYVLRTFKIAGELDDPSRSLTVFAPTNQAIQNLGRCFGLPPISLSIQAVIAAARQFVSVDFDREMARTGLYHMTEGRRPWADVLKTVGYSPLLGGTWVSTSADRTGLVGTTPSFPDATVVNRDAPIRADNGLLYKIDLALLPYKVPPGDIRC